MYIANYICNNLQIIAIKICTPVFLLILETLIYFIQSLVQVTEGQGSVMVSLIITNSLSVDITIRVIVSNATATGEEVAIYRLKTIIYNFLTM